MQDFKVPHIKKIYFSAVLGIRIYDTNYGNHLGHDSFVSLLHEARLMYLNQLGYPNELNIHGFGILVTNLVVNYLAEAFFSNKIIINIEVGDISKTSIQLIYQAFLKQTNKEMARALTTMTFYDYEKSKVAKIPKEFLSTIDNKLFTEKII